MSVASFDVVFEGEDVFGNRMCPSFSFSGLLVIVVGADLNPRWFSCDLNWEIIGVEVNDDDNEAVLVLELQLISEADLSFSPLFVVSVFEFLPPTDDDDVNDCLENEWSVNEQVDEVDSLVGEWEADLIAFNLESLPLSLEETVLFERPIYVDEDVNCVCISRLPI